MALTPEQEILREEALKFYDEVQSAQTHAVAGGHEEAVKEEFRKFLNRVRHRFAGDTRSTHRKFMETFLATTCDRFWLSEVYTTLFIGHADLFHEFELFLNTGSAESHREIENLRVRVRQDFLGEFDKVLIKCWSATERMEEIQRRNEIPGNITRLQAEYIERAWFSDDDDPAVKVHMMTDLLTEPRRFCDVVLPCLMTKQKVLWQMYAFVTG